MSYIFHFLFITLTTLTCGSTSKASEIVREKSFVQDSFPDFEYITGRFDPATHPDFTEVPIQYADKAGRYIRKETLGAFIRMFEAALKDGIQLRIISATRNFEAQKKIWEDKWFGRRILEDGVNAYKDISDPKARALKILLYSSMPGTSRHHWGTDIDINSLDPKYFAKGKGKKEYQWLVKNGPHYGFCQTYTEFSDQRKTGYQPEKWHWTYMPVSSICHTWATKNLTDDKISGFAGSETAIEIHVINRYVLGIHPDCVKK